MRHHRGIFSAAPFIKAIEVDAPVALGKRGQKFVALPQLLQAVIDFAFFGFEFTVAAFLNVIPFLCDAEFTKQPLVFALPSDVFFPRNVTLRLPLENRIHKGIQHMRSIEIVFGDPFKNFQHHRQRLRGNSETFKRQWRRRFGFRCRLEVCSRHLIGIPVSVFAGIVFHLWNGDMLVLIMQIVGGFPRSAQTWYAEFAIPALRTFNASAETFNLVIVRSRHSTRPPANRARRVRDAETDRAAAI